MKLATQAGMALNTNKLIIDDMSMFILLITEFLQEVLWNM